MDTYRQQKHRDETRHKICTTRKYYSKQIFENNVWCNKAANKTSQIAEIEHTNSGRFQCKNLEKNKNKEGNSDKTNKTTNKVSR